MRALLFAAGLGTRLRPLTDTMPKAMVPVLGQPLLHHTITRLIDAGTTEVVVNVHHFGEQIIDYLNHHAYPIHILVSDERQQLLDTGGGLRRALPLFSPIDEPVLLHNVDIFSNADLPALVEQHGDCDVQLLVSERDTQRYLLFDDEMRLVGWTNVATGEVRSPYPNLQPTQYRKLAFAGIHTVSPRIAPLMMVYPDKFPIMQFYLEQCAQLQIRGVVQTDLHLLDVGKLDTITAAEAYLNSTK